MRAKAPPGTRDCLHGFGPHRMDIKQGPPRSTLPVPKGLVVAMVLLVHITIASGLGILVPAYFNIDSNKADFDRLLPAATQLGSSLVIVVNPSNGPLEQSHPQFFLYKNFIDNARNNGATVVGYVFTQLGTRNTALITADIDRWYDYYAVDGIFFDETSPDPAVVGNYKSYQDHVIARAAPADPFIVLNPGVSRDDGAPYLDAGDVIIIKEDYEDKYADYSAWDWILAASDAEKFSFLGHESSDYTCIIAAAEANNVHWVYTTDFSINGNPWAGLASFFEEMVQDIYDEVSYTSKCGDESALTAGIGLQKVVPQGGSIHGGTVLTLYGTLLTTIVPDGVSLAGTLCDVDTLTATDSVLQCVTRAPALDWDEGGTTSVVTTVTVTDGSEAATCSNVALCSYDYNKVLTPLAQSASMMIPGVEGVLQMAGAFLTTDMLDVEAITVGGSPCMTARQTEDENGVVAIERFEIEIANGQQTMSCSPRAVPGFHNVTIDINLGRAGWATGSYQVSPVAGLYTVMISAVVTSVSPSAGSALGGGQITIQGRGFGYDTGDVRVEAGGARCEILSLQGTELVCEITSPPTGHMGGAGLYQEIYSSLPSGVVTIDDFLSYVNITAPSRKEYLQNTAFSSGIGAGSVVRGYLVAPYSGSYQLALSSDGVGRVVVQGLVTVDVATPAVRGIFESSAVFSMTAGTPYYFEIYHLGVGSDHCELALRSNAATPYSDFETNLALHETQSLQISGTGGDHYQRISFPDALTGDFDIYWMDGPAGTLNATTATAESVQAAVEFTMNYHCSPTGGTVLGGLDSFEDSGVWNPWNYKYIPELVKTTAYCGRGSMRLPAGWAKRAMSGSYSLSAYPFMCMAYRFPADAIVTMLIHIDAIGWRAVKVTDTPGLDSSLYSYGMVADWSVGSASFPGSVETDNNWHYRCIDLLTQIQSLFGLSGTFFVSDVMFHSPSLAYDVVYNDGGEMYIDDFAIASAEVQLGRNDTQASASLLDSVSVTDTSSGSTRTFDVTFKPIACLDYDVELMSSSSGSVSISRGSGGGAGLGGSFSFGYQGSWSSPVPFGANTATIEAAISEVVGIPASLTGPPVYTCTELSFSYTFGLAANVDQLAVDISAMTGAGVVSAGSTSVDGGLFFPTIPADFLRSYEDVPVVTVAVNESPGICSGSCAYSPVSIAQDIYVTTASPSEVTAHSNLTIVGSGFYLGQELLGQPRVYIGGAECVSHEITNTTLVCEVPLVPARNHSIQVAFEGFGFVNTTSTFVSVQPTVESYSPSEAAADATGIRLTLYGSGFDTDGTRAWVGSAPCHVLPEFTDVTQAVCEIETKSPAGSFDVVLSSGLHNVTALNQFIFRSDIRMNITSVTPAEIPIAQATLLIQGNNIASTASVTVDGVVTPCDGGHVATSTVVTCTISRIAPGPRRIGLYDGTTGVADGEGLVVALFHINRVEPQHGSVVGGNLVTIHGQGFGTSAMAISVAIGNDTTCDIVEVSPSVLTCAVSNRSMVHKVEAVVTGTAYSLVSTSAWLPANLTVQTGDTVRWEWYSLAVSGHPAHNVAVRQGAGYADVIERSETSYTGSFERRFDVAGTFRFSSEPHADRGMHGYVHVLQRESAVMGEITLEASGMVAQQNTSSVGEALSDCAGLPASSHAMYALDPCISPNITGVAPTSAYAGRVVTIHGWGFLLDSNVSIAMARLQCNTTLVTSTQIEFIVPASLGYGSYVPEVVVGNVGYAMVDTTAAVLTLRPEITKVTPLAVSVLGETEMTIHGMGFAASSALVRIGRTSCHSSFTNETTIFCRLGRPGNDIAGYRYRVLAGHPAVYLSFDEDEIDLAADLVTIRGDTVETLAITDMGITLDASMARFSGNPEGLTLPVSSGRSLTGSATTIELKGSPSMNTTMTILDHPGMRLMFLGGCPKWQVWIRLDATLASGSCDSAFASDECASCQGTVVSDGLLWVVAGAASSWAQNSVLIEHVAVKVAQGTVEVYVEGQLGASELIPFPLHWHSVSLEDYPVVVGPGYYGLIDEIAIHRSALQADVIAARTDQRPIVTMENIHDGLSPGLFASCPLDRCTVNMTADGTPQLNNVLPLSGPPGTLLNVTVKFPSSLSPGDSYITIGGEICSNLTVQTAPSPATHVMMCNVPQLNAGDHFVELISQVGASLINSTSVIVFDGTWKATGSITSVLPGTSSTSGGQVVTLRGLGFSKIPRNNLIDIGGAPCEVLTADFEVVTCRTGKHAQIGQAAVTAKVMGSMSEMPYLAMTPSSCCPFVYTTPSATLIAATIELVSAGPITIAGTGLNTGAVNVTLVGPSGVEHDCAVTSTSSTAIRCVAPTLEMGTYSTVVHVGGDGWAGGGPVQLVQRARISSITPVGPYAYGGGVKLTLAGQGFPEFSPRLSGGTGVRPVFTEGLSWAVTAWGWPGSSGRDASANIAKVVVVDLDSGSSEIAAMHARGQLVVCHFSAGKTEPYRLDYRLDNSTWEAVAVADDGTGHEWLNIRELAKLQALLSPRLDRAADKGCDAVVPSDLDCFESIECLRAVLVSPTATLSDGIKTLGGYQSKLNQWLATSAHERGLAIGLRNCGTLASRLQPDFDFAVVENCVALGACDDHASFVEAGKLVMAAEFSNDVSHCAVGSTLGYSFKFCDGLLTRFECIRGEWHDCVDPSTPLGDTEYHTFDASASAKMTISVCPGVNAECSLTNATAQGLVCDLSCYRSSGPGTVCSSGGGESCDVTVSYRGVASVADSGVNITYANGVTPVVTAIDPAVGPVTGGSRVTIRGFDFPVTGAQELRVFIGDRPCPVVSSSFLYVECETSNSTLTGPMAVEVEKIGLGLATVAGGGVVYEYAEYWSDWAPSLSDGDAVTVPAGVKVVLDVSPPVLSKLTIAGVLSWADAGEMASELWLQAHEIVIASGGTMRMGSEAQPYRGRARITLTGAASPQLITVSSGGTLSIHAMLNSGFVPWVTLDSPSAAGSSTLSVSSALDSAWHVGATGLIVATYHSPEEGEVFTIAGISGDNDTLLLSEPTAYHHEATATSPAGPSFPSVRQHAEVALLTRRIVIEGEHSLALSAGLGGRLFIGIGAQAFIDGVEFRYVGSSSERFGAAVTFLGVIGGTMRRSVVQQSSGEGIMLGGGTTGVLLDSNIVYNVHGHAYNLMSALESDNTLQGNIGVRSLMPTAILSSDPLPCVYSLKSPSNHLLGNHAAGSLWSGFCLDVRTTGGDLCVEGLPMGSFVNNTAHSCLGPALRLAGNYVPRDGWHGCWGKLLPAVFDNFVSYGCGDGFLGEGSMGHLSILNSAILGATNAAVNITGVDDEFAWGGLSISGTVLASGGGDGHAVVAPGADGLSVLSSALVDYAVPLAHCGGCTLNSGGFKSILSDVTRINTTLAVAWRWKHEGLWIDMDGSFSGVAGGFLAPSSGLLPPTDCSVTSGDGMLCTSSVSLKRISLFGVSPASPNGILIEVVGIGQDYASTSVDSSLSVHTALVPEGAIVAIWRVDNGTVIYDQNIVSYSVESADIFSGEHVTISNMLNAQPYPDTVLVNNKDSTLRGAPSDNAAVQSGSVWLNSQAPATHMALTGDNAIVIGPAFTGMPSHAINNQLTYTQVYLSSSDFPATPYGLAYDSQVAWSSNVMWGDIGVPVDGSEVHVGPNTRLLVDVASTLHLSLLNITGMVDITHHGGSQIQADEIDVAAGGHFVVNGPSSITGEIVVRGNVTFDGKGSVITWSSHTYGNDVGDASVLLPSALNVTAGSRVLFTSADASVIIGEIRTAVAVSGPYPNGSVLALLDSPLLSFRGPGMAKVAVLNRSIQLTGGIRCYDGAHLTLKDVEIYGGSGIAAFEGCQLSLVNSVVRDTISGGGGVSLNENALGEVLGCVVHNTLGSGIVVVSSSARVEGNLVSQSTHPVGCDAFLNATAALVVGPGVSVKNNTAVGSPVGFWIAGDSCDSVDVLGNSNSIHSCPIGVRVDGTPGQHCTVVHGYSVSRSSLVGVWLQSRGNVTISNVTVAGCQTGMLVAPIVIGGGRGISERMDVINIAVKNSSVSASEPAAPCWGGSSRIGIEFLDAALSKSPLGSTRSSAPLVEILYTIEAVELLGFTMGTCGRARDYGLKVSSGPAISTIVGDVNWGDTVDHDSKVWVPSQAAPILDTAGSLCGSPQCVIYGRAHEGAWPVALPRTLPPSYVVGLVASSCAEQVAWNKARACVTTAGLHVPLVLEIRDGLSSGSSFLSVESPPRADMLRQEGVSTATRYYTGVFNGTEVEVHGAVAAARVLRIAMLHQDSKAGVVIKIRGLNPRWLTVHSSAGTVVPPSNQDLLAPSSTSGLGPSAARHDLGAHRPLPSSPHGTSFYDWETYSLYLTVSGSGILDVVEWPVLKGEFTIGDSSGLIESSIAANLASAAGLPVELFVMKTSSTALPSAKIAFMVGPPKNSTNPPLDDHLPSMPAPLVSMAGLDLGNTASVQQYSHHIYNDISMFYDQEMESIAQLDHGADALANQYQTRALLLGVDIDLTAPMTIIPSPVHSAPTPPGDASASLLTPPLSSYTRPFSASNGEAISMVAPDKLRLRDSLGGTVFTGTTMSVTLDLADNAGNSVSTLGLGTEWEVTGNLFPEQAVQFKPRASLRMMDVDGSGDQVIQAVPAAISSNSFADGVATLEFDISDPGNYYIIAEATGGFSMTSDVFTVESETSPNIGAIVGGVMAGVVVCVITACLSCACILSLVVCCGLFSTILLGIDASKKILDSVCMLSFVIRVVRYLLSRREGKVPLASFLDESDEEKPSISRPNILGPSIDHTDSDSEGTPILGPLPSHVPRRSQKRSLLNRLRDDIRNLTSPALSAVDSLGKKKGYDRLPDVHSLTPLEHIERGRSSSFGEAGDMEGRRMKDESREAEKLLRKTELSLKGISMNTLVHSRNRSSVSIDSEHLSNLEGDDTLGFSLHDIKRADDLPPVPRPRRRVSTDTPLHTAVIRRITSDFSEESIGPCTPKDNVADFRLPSLPTGYLNVNSSSDSEGSSIDVGMPYEPLEPKRKVDPGTLPKLPVIPIKEEGIVTQLPRLPVVPISESDMDTGRTASSSNDDLLSCESPTSVEPTMPRPVKLHADVLPWERGSTSHLAVDPPLVSPKTIQVERRGSATASMLLGRRNSAASATVHPTTNLPAPVGQVRIAARRGSLQPARATPVVTTASPERRGSLQPNPTPQGVPIGILGRRRMSNSSQVVPEPGTDEAPPPRYGYKAREKESRQSLSTGDVTARNKPLRPEGEPSLEPAFRMLRRSIANSTGAVEESAPNLESPRIPQVGLDWGQSSRIGQPQVEPGEERTNHNWNMPIIPLVSRRKSMLANQPGQTLLSSGRRSSVISVGGSSSERSIPDDGARDGRSQLLKRAKAILTTSRVPRMPPSDDSK